MRNLLLLILLLPLFALSQSKVIVSQPYYFLKTVEAKDTLKTKQEIISSLMHKTPHVTSKYSVYVDSITGRVYANLSGGVDTTKIIYSNGGNNVMNQDLNLNNNKLLLGGEMGASTKIVHNGYLGGLQIQDYSNVSHFSVDGGGNVSLNGVSSSVLTIKPIENNSAYISTNLDSIRINPKLCLYSGIAVNKFSSDATLSGNSNTTIPTERAVKSYVDSHASEIDTTYIYQAINLKADKSTTLNNGFGINTIGDLSENRTITVDTGTIVSKLELTSKYTPLSTSLTKWGNSLNSFTFPNNKFGTSSNLGVRFFTNNTEKARLDSLGCLFIGATTFTNVGSNKLRIGNKSAVTTASKSTSIDGCIISSTTAGTGTPSLLLEEVSASGSSGGATLGLMANDGSAIGDGNCLGTIFFGGQITGTDGAVASDISSFAIGNWSGSATGSRLVFRTTTPTTSTKPEVLILTGGKMSLANTTNAASNSPTYTLSINGNAAADIGMQRHTTTNTAGKNLSIVAGGATSGATDKTGGSLYLKTGTSTGNAAAGILFFTPDTLLGAGTTDRAPTLMASIGYKGLKLYGNATVWDDLQFQVSSLKSVGVASKPDYDLTNLGLLFPKNDTTESIGMIVQMPHSWKEGSAIYPHIHIAQSSTDTATWKIKYRVYNIGAAIPSTWTIITSNGHTTTYTSGTIHQLVTFPSISMTSKTLSCIIDMIVYRSDNLLTGDALMKQIDIHFEKDGLGSSTITTKY